MARSVAIRDRHPQPNTQCARPQILSQSPLLGDYLQRATNGIYRAATHRVGAVTADRISIQYKHRPAYSTVVAPLEPCTSAGTTARHAPFDTGTQYASLLQSLLDR